MNPVELKKYFLLFICDYYELYPKIFEKLEENINSNGIDDIFNNRRLITRLMNNFSQEIYESDGYTDINIPLNSYKIDLDNKPNFDEPKNICHAILITYLFGFRQFKNINSLFSISSMNHFRMIKQLILTGNDSVIDILTNLPNASNICLLFKYLTKEFLSTFTSKSITSIILNYIDDTNYADNFRSYYDSKALEIKNIITTPIMS